MRPIECMHCHMKTQMPLNNSGIYEFNCPSCGMHITEEDATPIYTLLYYKAQKSITLQDYRSAIIEISSATEAFIKNLIKLYLINENQKYVVSFILNNLRGRNQFNKLFYLCYSKKIYKIPDYKYFDIRNKIIHDGYIPTKTEAVYAQKCYKKIVANVINKHNIVPQLVMFKEGSPPYKTLIKKIKEGEK